MTNLLKNAALIGATVIISSAIYSSAIAQGAERPDLQGIWTNASLTKLSRPDGVESLIVSAAQA